MRIATWNLNNRVGKTRFRPEAADAAMALGADVLVFTEFFPQQHESPFRGTLADAGWSQQMMSVKPSEVGDYAEKLSKIIVKFRGKNGEAFLQDTRNYDVGTAQQFGQVSNYMKFSFAQNPSLTESDLAILGNANCLAKF